MNLCDNLLIKKAKKGNKNMKLITRILIMMASLFIAEKLVPGIHINGNGWIVFSVMAVTLGLLNATIRPILKLLSCGLIILTLGLFTFIINAAVLLLASWISINFLNAQFFVDNFWSAILGSVIVSIVSLVLNSILLDKKKK